jgi:2-keto-4-pentenoate hydratase
MRHTVSERGMWAARRLAEAPNRAIPCAPVRDLISAADARVVGRKIGLHSQAVQPQLGVDRPEFGMFLNDMAVADGGVALMARLLQPRAGGRGRFRARRGSRSR